MTEEAHTSITRRTTEQVGVAGRLGGLLLTSLLVHAASAGAATVVIQPSSQDAYISQDRPNRIAGANPTNTRIRVLGVATGNTDPARTGAISACEDPQRLDGELRGGGALRGQQRARPHAHARPVSHPDRMAGDRGQVEQPTAIRAVGHGDGSRRRRAGLQELDVTPDVREAVTLCANDHGWMIKDVSETATNQGVNYIAKEENGRSEALNRPKMTVVFLPPSCSTDADCSDTNFCTTHERCQGGICVVDAVDCDDGDPCTTDICDCASGCINAPICDDGFSCTIDTCDPATLTCTNTPVQSVCAAECSTGTCVADPDSTTVDPVTGCEVARQPAGTPCNDGDSCTVADQCNAAGICVAGPPADCTPDDPCRETGACDPATGACVTTPKAVNCDDPVCVEDPACVEICDGG